MNPRRILDITRNSDAALKLMEGLRSRVVGQDEALVTLVNILESYQAGMTDDTRPAGSVMFLGPTGSGKTSTVEAMCESLFGNEKALVKIDCAEFQHSHEIAKLIGSPPGYLGHRETPALLQQAFLDAYHTENLKLSIVLFDEIEKASDALWQLLLGILDKATLTLGDNKQVNFSKSIIVMTTNLGQVDDSSGLGFIHSEMEDNRLAATAINAAKKHFTPEFINRLDNLVVFKALTEPQIREILKLELNRLRIRIFKSMFLFNLTSRATDKIIEEGYSRAYGARALRRVIEKRIRVHIARLMATGQIKPLDMVIIDEVGKPDFEFTALAD